MKGAAMKTVSPMRAKGTVRLEGTMIVQAGKPILLTAMTAEDLGQHKRVDMYDPFTKKGYQRAAQTARIHAAARYYGEKGGRMPNPLLVNIREEDFTKVTIVINGDEAGFEAARADWGNWIGAGYIEIPEDLAVWLYDGQHRADGLG